MLPDMCAAANIVYAYTMHIFICVWPDILCMQCTVGQGLLTMRNISTQLSQNLPWWQRPATLSHKMQWATYITRYGWSIGFVNDLREHAVSAFLIQIQIQECVCCVCVFVCVHDSLELRIACI